MEQIMNMNSDQNKMTAEQIARTQELASAVANSRECNFDNFSLIIGADVFPPDLGLSSRMLADALTIRHNKHTIDNLIDIGTGSLYLALHCRRIGVPNVWATDIHQAALECAKTNLARYPDLAPIVILESDLFSSIPLKNKFNTIVFNHPFYPIEGTPVAGLGADGGRTILQRFFEHARRFLAVDGRIIISSCSIASSSDFPEMVAPQFGLAVEEISSQIGPGGHQAKVLSLYIDR